MDLLIVAAALAAAFGLGLRRGRASGLTDYVLAGRLLTLPSFVATLVPTFYGGVLGIGEFTWRSGLSNWTVMALPYYVFALIYALWLAGRVRVEPGMTIPDHLERAYGRNMAAVGAALVFVLALPADELLMSGTLLAHLASVPPPLAMAVIAAGAAAMIWRGGLRADVAGNRLQIALMYGGFALILPFALRAVPAGGLSASLPPGHLTLTGGLGLPRMIAWWLIAGWTLVDPSFHQRCAAAKDPRTAKLGILVSIGFWAVFDLMTTAAGLCARAILPDVHDPLLSFPMLADAILPDAARGLFYAGLASSIAAALQGGALLAAATAGKDLGRLRGADEATQERWARYALIPTLGLAWVMAMALPSVVELWYSVGSATIPGLLLPLLGVYFPQLRRAPNTALTASLLGCAASAACLLLGLRPFGLEPMLPGLLVSGAVWAFGRRNTP